MTAGMVIKDLIKTYEKDFDVYDNVFDACVTCCDIYPLDESDWYYKVIDKIYADVNVIEFTEDSCTAVADWSGYIQRNKEKLESFMKEYWRKQYTGDDFTEEWIKEIHAYFAGYTSDDIYKLFYERVLA